MAPRRTALALLVATLAACFDGTFLVGRVCEDDSRCGPSLQCVGGVCADPDSPDGVPAPIEWTQIIAGSGSNDEGLAVVADSLDNTIVTGYADYGGQTEDIVTRRINPDGAGSGQYRNQSAVGDDRGRALVRTPADSFVSAGHFFSGAHQNVYIFTLNSSLDFLGGINDVELANSSAAGVTIDEAGDIYIAGSIEDPDEKGNLLIARYTAGERAWSRSEDGGAGLDDDARAIAYSPDGTIVVAGTAVVKSNHTDIWVRKYDLDGMELWTYTHDEDGGDDEANGVAVDSKGDIIIAGAVDESAREEALNIWIRKLDKDGEDTRWTVTYKSDTDVDDIATAVVIDSEDNGIIAGHIGGGGGNSSNAWVRKLDGDDGKAIWTDVFKGDGGGDDQALGVAVDDDDRVIATGSTEVEEDNRDFWVRKYLPFREL